MSERSNSNRGGNRNGGFKPKQDFRGKPGKFTKKNPYIDRKEFKSDEIKKSLTHRARLRKNYFKLLEKEGISTERKDELNEDNGEKDEQRHVKEKKPMNFAERAKIAKERKEATRVEKLQAIKDKRAIIEQKSRERDFKKDKMAKKSRSGQPLMGPRINNLLDKIKSDMK